ncbi:MAG: gamma-glutamyltransferase family protein [Haloarculaceae archaeon]
MDPDLDRFESRRSTVYAPSGLVATSQPLAAAAGRDVLARGGNAFDAAVAAAAALNVVEPMSTGIGGDAFALFRTADGEVGAMRACGPAPERATRDRVRSAVAAERDRDPAAATMPEHGPHTVTVPGAARGWEATVQAHGRLSLAEVLQPAIRYAADGFPVTEVVAAEWTDAHERFDRQNARDTFLFGDATPSAGQSVSLPRLAETFRRVSEGGADVVYEGGVGETIASAVQDAGGVLTVADLAGFEVEWPDPLSTTYGGCEVFELGPTNQGQIALEALNVAAEVDAGAHPPGSVERVHRLVEATKLAFHDGHHYVTDPDFESIPALHDPAHAAARAERVGQAALPPAAIDVGLPDATGEDADTVLVTVADDAGNLVSFINSLYDTFGSGVVAGETGVVLQNRGASFSLDAGAPNRLEPGKRPFHTLLPALARFGAEDWAAFGVMGGSMQPQGHVQVCSHLVDDGKPLQRALDEPRWRYRADGTLAVEERVADGLAVKLARRGHDVRIEPPGSFGGGQIIRRRAGVCSGATEPRKDGHVAPL